MSKVCREHHKPEGVDLQDPLMDLCSGCLAVEVKRLREALREVTWIRYPEDAREIASRALGEAP